MEMNLILGGLIADVPELIDIMAYKRLLKTISGNDRPLPSTLDQFQSDMNVWTYKNPTLTRLRKILQQGWF